MKTFSLLSRSGLAFAFCSLLASSIATSRAQGLIFAGGIHIGGVEGILLNGKNGKKISDVQFGDASGALVLAASWSPCGTHLAVGGQGAIDADGTNSGLRVYELSGNSLVKVAALDNLPVAQHVAWSPDGSHLAYIQTNRLQVLSFDGASLTPASGIVEISGSFSALAWSPNGTDIAVSAPNFSATIQIYQFDGSSLAQTAITYSTKLDEFLVKNLQKESGTPSEALMVSDKALRTCARSALLKSQQGAIAPSL